MKSTMIFTGGLGNQMFEYALVLVLRNRGHHVQIDTSYYDFFKMHNGYELDRVFGTINKQGIHMYWLRTLHKFRPKGLYLMDAYLYNEKLLTAPKPYMFGYWQDERYFSDIEDDIRKMFTFRDVDEKNKLLAKEMLACNSVSLHIRRGDYAEFGMTLMGDAYYYKAIEYIRKKVETPFFYVFSDDVDEAKGMADKMGINYKLITHNKRNDSYKDMYLMSQCKHNIIANSSFSWWGAWLNNNREKIVIAPQLWDTKMKDYHPQCNNWILI